MAMNVAGCLCPAPIQQQSIPEIDLQLDVNLKVLSSLFPPHLNLTWSKRELF